MLSSSNGDWNATRSEVSTVTVKLEVLVLPAKSVAVTLMVCVPGPSKLPTAGVDTTVGCGSTLSVAVDAGTTAGLLQVPRMVRLLGKLIVGASVSRTITLKLQLLWLPLASVAVQITVFVPSGKVLPEAGVHTTTGFASQLSVAMGAG